MQILVIATVFHPLWRQWLSKVFETSTLKMKMEALAQTLQLWLSFTKAIHLQLPSKFAAAR